MSSSGDEAFNPDGLVRRCIRFLKEEFPDLVIYTDVALDPYSSDGHDGIVREDGIIACLKTTQDGLDSNAASRHGLKALETSASRRDLLEEDEKDFIQEFLEEALTFRELFPNGEERLLKAATEFFDDYFETVQLSLQPENGHTSAAEMNAYFRQLSVDVTRMNELVPEAKLPGRASEESDYLRWVKSMLICPVAWEGSINPRPPIPGPFHYAASLGQNYC